jgi:hypothetical protein
VQLTPVLPVLPPLEPPPEDAPPELPPMPPEPLPPELVAVPPLELVPALPPEVPLEVLLSGPTGEKQQAARAVSDATESFLNMAVVLRMRVARKRRATANNLETLTKESTFVSEN